MLLGDLLPFLILTMLICKNSPLDVNTCLWPAGTEHLKDKTVLELKGCVSYRTKERKEHNMHGNMSSSMCCKLQEVF